MPGTYPAAPPTLSGDQLTISRFLQQPQYLKRRLRDFRDLRFVSDQILTQRYRAQGGAILYEQSEPFTNSRPVESVPPGSGYPKADPALGTAAVAAVQKWGQDTELTDEEIDRNIYQGMLLDRKLRKVVNSVIQQVDGVTLSAIASAVTATQAATAAWNAASPKLMQDILLAKKVIVGQNLGYNPDTLLIDDTKYAYLMSDTNITNALRRETTTNPIYTGQIDTVAGLKIVVSPSLPTSDPWVIDSTQLGGMADEQSSAPGYSVDQMAVQVKAMREEDMDKWILRGRRLTVPVVQELGAACRITGT